MDRQRIPDVETAFDILLEEMEAEIESVNEAIRDVAGRGEYRLVKDLVKRAEDFVDLQQRMATLRDEWEAIASGSAPVEKRRPGLKVRLEPNQPSRSERTSQSAFYVPILSAVESLGGAAIADDVLDRVHDLMKDRLLEADHEPLPSDPRSVRWRNTVRWACLSLVKHSLLHRDSPEGTWEITDQGRRWLRQQQST